MRVYSSKNRDSKLKPVFDRLMEEGIITKNWRKNLKKIALKLMNPDTPQEEKDALALFILWKDKQELRDWLEIGGAIGWGCVPGLKRVLSYDRKLKEEVERWSLPTVIRNALGLNIQEEAPKARRKKHPRILSKTLKRLGKEVLKNLDENEKITKEKIIEIGEQMGIKNMRRMYWYYKKKLVEKEFLSKIQIVDGISYKLKRELFISKINRLRWDGKTEINGKEVREILRGIGYSEKTIRCRGHEFVKVANEILSNGFSQ